MKFSVIVVCLNAGVDLPQTVNNILEQSYADYEIIVKDGFSTDGSIEKLPVDNKIRLIQVKDTGIYDAMNQGISVAQGDYLIFINAGDKFYSADVLVKLSRYIMTNTASLYYGHCFNESLKVYSNSPKKLTTFFCFRSMICHQAMIFERKYIATKKYDNYFKVSADREILLCTVIKEKLKTQYIPIVIARYKGSGFCESEKSRERIKEENIELQKKYFTLMQVIWYRFLIILTFPHLRRAIAKNSKLVRPYKHIVGMIYGNKHN